MAEFSVRAIPDIGLYLIPVSLVVANFFADRADREKTLQGFNFGKRFSELPDAAFIRRLGSGMWEIAVSPIRFVCIWRTAAMMGTIAETPTTVDMTIRVDRGPSNT